MNRDNKKPFLNITQGNKKGQAVVEFILLFLVIFVFSLGLLGSVNVLLGKRWTDIAYKITGPTADAPSSTLNLR